MMNVDKQEAMKSEHECGTDGTAEFEKEPMLYCPVCSTRLVSLKCKLVCENCGYYTSCADYY